MNTKEELRQGVINRNVPLLIKELLGINAAAGEGNLIYEKCLETAKFDLQHHKYPESDGEAVNRNMKHFVDRYRSERLTDYGETFQQLANVLLKHPVFLEHEDLNFKWRLLEFMLSVNYEAFRSVRRNRDQMDQRKNEILEEIEKLKNQTQYSPPEVAKSDSGFNVNNNNIWESEMTQSECVETFSLDLSLDRSDVSDVTLQKDDLTSFDIFSPHRKSSPIPYYPNSFNLETRRLESLTSEPFKFTRVYGEKLQSRLCAAESRVLFEYILMFFIPQDLIHFRVTDLVIKLRVPSENAQVPEVELLKPLKEMQILQQFLDKFTRHKITTRSNLSTFNCQFRAVQRLLKPVMEFLIYFGERVTKEKEVQSFQSFWTMAKEPFRRLELLAKLTRHTYMRRMLKDQQPAEHERCFHSVNTLLSIAMGPCSMVERACSVAILLCSLKPYCKLLGNWYRLGEFLDWHKEFLAEHIRVAGGHSEYRMRPMDNTQNSHFYLLVQKHILSSGKAIAFLYDRKLIDDFATHHEDLLSPSLFNLLMESIIDQLKSYEMAAVRNDAVFPAPDILDQMDITDEEPLRRLFYAYHKELEPDHREPLAFRVDQLILRLQRCLSYTPLADIICHTLDNYLNQRTLLVNSYVVHMVREDFHLMEHVRLVRSVYLLFDLWRYEKEFDRFLDTLAVKDLQTIIASHNCKMSHFFVLAAPFKHLLEIKLDYKCDDVVGCIITKRQLHLLSTYFQVNLEIHHSKKQLEDLPLLNTFSGVEFEKTLISLRHLMIKALRRYKSYLDDLQEIQQTLATDCDMRMMKCSNLQEVASIHEKFVSDATECAVTAIPHRSDLKVLFSLVEALKGIWKNMTWSFAEGLKKRKLNEFELQYEYQGNLYLQSLLQTTIVVHRSLIKYNLRFNSPYSTSEEG